MVFLSAFDMKEKVLISSLCDHINSLKILPCTLIMAFGFGQICSFINLPPSDF